MSRIFEESRGKIALLITDGEYPGDKDTACDKSGETLAREVLNAEPISVVYVSAKTKMPRNQFVDCTERIKFLQKPFEPDVLIELVREALKKVNVLEG